MPDSFEGPYGTIQSILDQSLGASSSRSPDELDRLAKFDTDRHARMTLARRYYEGDHETLLTDRMKQYLQKHAGVKFRENFVSPIVDALTNRLQVIGITTSLDYEDEKAKAPPVVAPPPAPPAGPGGGPGGISAAPSAPAAPVAAPVPAPPPPLPPVSTLQPPAPDKPEMDLGAWLWNRVWDGTKGDELQIEVHRGAVRDGDSFVIVDFDTKRNRPRFVRQTPDICRIVYEDGQKLYAIKKWYTRAKGAVNPEGRHVCRLNIYTEGSIEKWYRLHDKDESAGGWARWLDEDDKVWPLPWVDPNNEPLGIPVFHFANQRAEDFYGVPEHWESIPQQDGLNKSILDLYNILDQMGAPQRTVAGLDNTDSLKSAPGEVWSAPNENAKFSQYDAADPAGALASIEAQIMRMAVRSHTPVAMMYMQGGNVPSGESLKTAEAPLVDKCENRHIYFGNQWSEAAKMAAKVALIYAGDGKEAKPPVVLEDLDDASINVKWKDPHTQDEKAHAEYLQLLSTLGIPDEELWSRIEGLDVDAIKNLKAQTEYESAIRMRTMFDAGGPLGNPGAMDTLITTKPPIAGKPPIAPVLLS